MQTTMWCSSGVFSSATMCSPWRPVKPSEEIAAVASARSHSRKAGSAHAFATTLAPLRGPILVS